MTRFPLGLALTPDGGSQRRLPPAAKPYTFGRQLIGEVC